MASQSTLKFTVNAFGSYFGGIVRVLERLVGELRHHGAVSVVMLPPDAEIDCDVSVFSRQSHSRLASLARLLPESALQLLQRSDVWIEIAPSPLPLHRSSTSVVIVHDLGFLRRDAPHVSRGQWLYRSLAYRWSVHQSDLVVAVSQQTAAELLRISPRSRSKIVVLEPPIDYVFSVLDALLTEELDSRVERVEEEVNTGIDLLMFGHAENKGVGTALEMLTLSSDFRLRVICPEAKWIALGHADLAKKLGVESRVTVLSEISDTELVMEYLRADVFCMISSYEGYGLPVAEALACRTPTVISPLQVLESTGRGFAVRSTGLSAIEVSEAIFRAQSLPTTHWEEAQIAFRSRTWASWSQELLTELRRRTSLT